MMVRLSPTGRPIKGPRMGKAKVRKKKKARKPFYMKSFYMVSAMKPESCPIHRLRRHESEAEAVEHAKKVINLRAQNGASQLEFFVVKVVSKVSTMSAPVKVEKYK